jgi:hypothetical protein
MMSDYGRVQRAWLLQTWIIFGLVLFYVSFAAIGKNPLYGVANQIGPILLMASSLVTAYSLVRLQPLAVWAPLPWFLVIYALYYGFGPLVYTYGSEESITNMDEYYAVYPYDLLRTGLLNAVGLLGVCVGVLAAGSITVSEVFKAHREKRWRDPDRYVPRVILLFLAIGLPIKYLFALPYQLGLHDFIVPGGIAFLGKLVSLTIVLLVAYYNRLTAPYHLLCYVVIASEFVTALMTFSKLEVLTVGLLFVLGLYLRLPRVRTLIAGGVMLCVLYVVLTPFVLFARTTYEPRGVSSVVALTESASMYRRLSTDEMNTFLAGAQIWWTRLSYSNAQAYAMQAFDANDPGDSLFLAGYALVPRVLFPNKPVMSIGDKYTEAVTGRETNTFTSPGIFAEGYWNGGWTVVVVMGIFVGFLLARIGAFSEQAIGGGRFVFLPIVLIGLIMGFRPDDWFVLVYIGGLVQAAVLYLIIVTFTPPFMTQTSQTKM